MLTVTRKSGECIWVTDDIQIVVKEIRRNHVRIGVLAPQSMEIGRDVPPSQHPRRSQQLGGGGVERIAEVKQQLKRRRRVEE